MRRPSLLAGALLVGLVLVVAIVGLLWTPFSPTGNGPVRLAGPGWPHVLGTDAFGTDVLSRLMAGAKLVVLVGVLSVLGAAIIGVPVGLATAMLPRWLGEIPARLSDILYGFPALLLAILFAAALGGSTWTAVLAIGIASIPAFVRVARAASLEVLNQPFVEAAELMGINRLTIAWRHVLPNIWPVVLVQASVSFGLAILAEAGLSYLGLGSGPDEPTWGRMLREAQDHIFSTPLLALWPGFAVALATMGFNLLGDGLRDVLDPRLRERA
ncbi:ABC transporter permease [Tessaracoccus sp. OH4464_COT-324]|uniref:ABC transporter permease n=1 Tax=Tessaracoccus sp. OH4464_COT-324 TaxID=2491059 RepID=UPI000F636E22|nr:ABC transporter permease [Tessaracoccus sp. OH4464_COT-324]RRD47442.1 ABC transporter permease [Tessaracoccus sp. OH4464_COT-324]